MTLLYTKQNKITYMKENNKRCVCIPQNLHLYFSTQQKCMLQCRGKINVKCHAKITYLKHNVPIKYNIAEVSNP